MRLLLLFLPSMTIKLTKQLVHVPMMRRSPAAQPCGLNSGIAMIRPCFASSMSGLRMQCPKPAGRHV